LPELLHATYAQTGKSSAPNAMGMRPMQALAYEAREAQYLLIKSPPASGKSRALMFVALDKLRNQGMRKAIVAVPERSIGGSFQSTDLRFNGFTEDWNVKSEWNLCTAGSDEGVVAKSKVKALAAFLDAEDDILVCTHATLRFAFEELGAEAFDSCLIAIDEFHHASADEENKLGVLVRALMARDKAHIVAMTGSYFRGDSTPVLNPEDEARFERVTYTYYEQLNGYEHLKTLGIGYHFYRGRYLDSVMDKLDPNLKTIVHIPSVNAAESTKDKLAEVDHILGKLGTFKGIDTKTGFHLVEQADGRILKVADLVDDDLERRSHVMTALRDTEDRDAVDIIIALGMAKEGFDWVWCEHALTIGYRSSLTEIIQIIGRATRDAPGKPHARFTNLVAEPAADQGDVTDAVNDMLKAISGALLMEQVLAPNFKFHRRPDGVEKGEAWADDEGTIHIEVGGLPDPSTKRSKDIIDTQMDDLVAATCQAMDLRTVAPETAPEVATQMVMADIVERRHEQCTDEEKEEIRQHLAVRMNTLTLLKKQAQEEAEKEGKTGPASILGKPGHGDSGEGMSADTASATILKMVKKFINVQDLDIDLIESVNPFKESYDIASKTINSEVLSQVQAQMVEKRINMSEREAIALWPRIQRFRQQEGKPPNPNASDPLEKRLGEALAYIRVKKAERQRVAKGA